jgi:hypothetical protein
MKSCRATRELFHHRRTESHTGSLILAFGVDKGGDPVMKKQTPQSGDLMPFLKYATGIRIL